jgi:hypothetical protein
MNRLGQGKGRGLTLVESLMTILLVGIVLGIVAGICNEYANIIRFSARKDRIIIGARTGVDKLKIELEEATEVLTPTPSPAPYTPDSPVIKFKKINPSAVQRLGPPAPGTWDPWAPSYLVNVEYYVSRESLVRKVTFPDSSCATQTVAEGVSGLSAKNLGGSTYRFTVSFMDEQYLKTLTTVARLKDGQ